MSRLQLCYFYLFKYSKHHKNFIKREVDKKEQRTHFDKTLTTNQMHIITS